MMPADWQSLNLLIRELGTSTAFFVFVGSVFASHQHSMRVGISLCEAIGCF